MRRSRRVDIAKVDRRDHRIRWRRDARAGVQALVSAPDGDVVLAGSAPESGLAVARLAGRDGHERWRRIQPSDESHPGSAGDATVDRAGNVIVAGSLDAEFAVQKLDGSTGNESWRFTLPASSSANAVAVDAAGDVIAAGQTPGSPVLVKLAGATGQLLWQGDVAPGGLSDIALDPTGDVVVAMSALGQGSDFGVAKVAGTTGERRWLFRASGNDGVFHESATSVVADASGTVFAAGVINDGSGQYRGEYFTIARFDGATGARTWAYWTRGAGGGGVASELALGPDGTVVAIGDVVGDGTGFDGLLVALDATTGTPVRTRAFTSGVVVPQGCVHRSCPFGNDDHLTALAVDAGGGLVVAGRMKAYSGVGGSPFIRRLSLHR